MPPTQTAGSRAARLEQTWTSKTDVRASIELAKLIKLNKLIKIIKLIRFKYCLCEEAKTLVLQGCKAAGCRQRAALLQAARLQAAGCALQGCRQQVAHCKAAGKAAGSRLPIARLQAAGCKAAGHKAARQKCRTWLLSAAKIANCTSCTAAFAKRRKHCTVAIWHPTIATPPTRQRLQQARPRILSQNHASKRDQML